MKSVYVRLTLSIDEEDPKVLLLASNSSQLDLKDMARGEVRDFAVKSVSCISLEGSGRAASEASHVTACR